MSGTPKKRLSTIKGTASRSAKPQKSSTTQTRNSNKTPTQSKNTSASMAGRKGSQKSSSSSSATAPSKIAKRSIESSTQEESLKKRKKIWKDYDYENLPEFTDEQLADVVEHAIPFREWEKRRRKNRSGKSAS